MKTSLILIIVSLALGALYTQPGLFVALLPLIGFVALVLVAPVGKRTRSSPTAPALSKADVPTLFIEFLFAPPFLITSAVIIFYLGLACVANLLDATTVAIILPTAVLLGLIVAASLKKGLIPHPCSTERMSVFLLGLALNIMVFKFHWMNIYWGDPASLHADFVSRGLAQASSLAFNSILSFFTILPIIFFANLWCLRSNPSFVRSSKISISLAASLITGTIISSFLPVAWIYLSGHSFGQIPYEVRYIARDAIGLTIAISTVAYSWAGMLIAFSGSKLGVFAAAPVPNPRPREPLKPAHCLCIVAAIVIGFVYFLVDAIRSNLPEVYAIRAGFYTIAGQYRNALHDLSEAIQLKPGNAYAFEERACILSKLRRVDEAAQDLSRAISLMNMEHELKRHSKACYHFEHVVDKCLDEQRIELVIQLCDEMIAKFPNHFEAHFHKGLAFSKRGEHEQARQNFDRAISIEPDYAFVYAYRGSALRKLGQLNHAFEDALTALKERPDDPMALELRGSILLDLDCAQLALNDLNLVIERIDKWMEPDKQTAGRLYHTRSKIEDKFGMKAEASRDRTKSIELGFIPANEP